MKIIDVIEIMGDFDVPVNPMPPGPRPKGTLPIYSTQQGVHFYEEETVWGNSIDNKLPERIYDIKRELKQGDSKLENNERELNRYLAVFELLYARNKFIGDTGGIAFEQIKDYVSLLNKKIVESLDFSEVSGMNDLIDRVSKDYLYHELLFNVSVANCNKSDQYKGSIKPFRNYHFGNIKYHEELDRVNIFLYDDCVEVCPIMEGKTHEFGLDLKHKSTEEQKIVTALGQWRGYYTN